MKRSFIAPVLLAALVSLTACSGAKQAPTTGEQTQTPAAQQQAGPKTFKTEFGDLTFEKTPTKIVAINLQAIDSLVALGIKPVGYAKPGGEPVNYLGDALNGLPDVGSHSKPSIESIAALQPDLIIVDSLQQKDLVPELQKIAPVLGIRSASYQDTMNELKLVAEIVGKTAEAEKFVTEFDAKIKTFTSKVADKKSPKVMAMYGTAERSATWMPQSFIGSLMTALKAEHAYTGEADKEYPDQAWLSIEKVAESNPQLFFFMSTPGKELSKGLEANPAYKSTDAVKNGRVHEVDRQLWSRSRGPIAAGKILDVAFPLLYPDAK